MFEMIDKKKLAGIVLAGVLTISGTTYAFAAEPGGNSTKAVNQKQFFKFDALKTSDAIKSAIDKLVSSETITQAQADAVMKAYTPGEGRGQFKFMQKNNLDGLVKAGTITQAQANEISKTVKTGIAAKKTMEDIFKELVAAGTITEAQKEAVMKIFPNKIFTGRPARVEKFMGREEHIGFLDKLVTAGTITQAQADAYATAIKEARESRKLEAEVLKRLVTEGTITHAQADAIQKVFPSFEGKGMKMMFRNNPLDDLVADGTITQAQADAINSAVKATLNPSDKK